MTEKLQFAARQALEALEVSTDWDVGAKGKQLQSMKAITALRDALAEQAEQEQFDMDDHPPHRLCECRKCMEYFTPLPDCDAFAASGKPIAEQEPVIECDCETSISSDGSRLTKCGSDQMRRAVEQGHAFCKQQAEQEPVAVVEITYGREPECYVTGNIDDFPEGVFKLYAAPVRTKDLTDDEIHDVFKSLGFSLADPLTEDFSVARAVIAADREKNK